MAACVEIWESDPEALSYHGSGYVALGPPAQEEELAEVFERQQRIGYPSELHTGEDEVAAHMRGLFGDWRAEGLTVCLHERAGGFAFNRESMLGLADKARAAGASILEGVEVTGFSLDGSGAVSAYDTTAGEIQVDQVVVAVGPWIASLWEMLGQPDRIDVRQPGRLGGTRFADVDVLVPPGGRGGAPALDAHDRRWARVAGAARRLAPAPDRRRRQADHRRALGDLREAGPANGPGRRPAPDRRPELRGGPVPDRQRGAGIPGSLVRGALPLHGAVPGLPRELRPGAVRRGGRLQPRTTSPSSTGCSPTCTWPRTRTTATR